jgi:glycosyltransferase involved in cell wall biosynthesis
MLRKVLHVNAFDIFYGAARAVLRLHRGLRQSGLQSLVFVQNKRGDDKYIAGPQSKLAKILAVFRPYIDQIPLYLYPKRSPVPFHTQWFPNRFLSSLNTVGPDLLHLHWICDGFIRLETLRRIRKPIVWTFHDMWAFTGGCHYSDECTGYLDSCGRCPQLKSRREADLSRWTWKRKKKAWKDLNLIIVTPSAWLGECARNSPLFRNTPVKVIPNAIDLQVYKPGNQSMARTFLGLPQDQRIVLFGAIGATTDSRKGFQFLKPVFERLRETEKPRFIDLVIFGSSEPMNPPDFGFPTSYIGKLYDDVSLSLLYTAADVMLVPSIQEAFGQTASEALACGTPVVSFNTTGLRDIIDPMSNGYLARPFDVSDFADGIAWILADKDRWRTLSENARKKAVVKFGALTVANKYIQLYEEAMRKNHSR